MMRKPSCLISCSHWLPEGRFLLPSLYRRFGIGPRPARSGCETPPSSNGSRRGVSPDTCPFALGRRLGFDVACLLLLVLPLLPPVAVPQQCSIAVPHYANMLRLDLV